EPLVAQLFAGPPPQSLKDVAQRYGKLLAHIDQLHQAKRTELLAAKKGQPVEVTLADPHQEALRQLLYGPNALFRREQLTFQAEAGVRNQAEPIRFATRLNDVRLNHPASPARAMALEDLPRPKNSHVFLRGDRAKPGPEVPRQFLEFLAG